MASPQRRVPLAYEWGTKVVPPRGSPSRHQWFNWKHEFAVHSPPRKSPSRVSRTNTGTLEERAEMKMSLTRSLDGDYDPVVPRWATDEKTVLRFYGYFREAVPNSSDEISRTRTVTILAWPLDGTMKIVETVKNNSGAMGGMLVKRHRIARPDCSLITVDDLRLGNQIEVYGKTINITDCDKFTRNFFPAGVLGTPVETPVDPYETRRFILDNPNLAPRFHDVDFKEYLDAQSGKLISRLDRGAFNELSGKELKFRCLWEETHLLLRFFLATGEMTVMELGSFEGKDPFPTIFRRGKLPLDWRSIGSEMGGMPRDTPCYTPAHFKLGHVIDLYGRRVRLMDCDSTTREWYAERGHDIGESQAYPEPPPPLPRNQIPERDAFTIGSDEDTIQSCRYLVPPKPRKNYKKLLANMGYVLRYRASLKTDNPVDRERRFVVKFYLEDDTMMIFEQTVPNLGVVGGKFRERALIKKASGERFTPDDFGVGKEVTVSSFVFQLEDADAFTKRWKAAWDAGIPYVDPEKEKQQAAAKEAREGKSNRK